MSVDKRDAYVTIKIVASRLVIISHGDYCKDQLGMEEINAIADKSEMQTKESDSTGESSVTIKKETASSALRKRSPGNLKKDKDLDEVDKKNEKRVLLERWELLLTRVVLTQ